MGTDQTTLSTSQTVLWLRRWNATSLFHESDIWYDVKNEWVARWFIMPWERDHAGLTTHCFLADCLCCCTVTTWNKMRIRRGRDCLPISVLWTLALATAPGKRTSVCSETSRVTPFFTHHVATSTMLNLPWLYNATNDWLVCLTVKSVGSASKGSVLYIFERKLACVWFCNEGSSIYC